MASPQDSRIVHEMGFAPIDPVNVPVGWMIVKLYPKIVPLMPVHEGTHAFQVNKSTLVDLPTNLWLFFDAFGAQLNASLTVEGILSDWRWFFNKHWMDVEHPTILSFHNFQGKWFNNTTLVDEAKVLLPVQDSVVAQCRSLDMRFVQVQCTLDFALIITINSYPISSILWVSYYIELPQSSHAMINSNGGACTLISFLGPDNLHTLLPDVVVAIILTSVLQDGLILLEASDFNLQNANTNSLEIKMEIDSKILKLAWHQLCAFIFNELCPGYSNQPQAVLQHINQAYINGDGNLLCTPVFAYY